MSGSVHHAAGTTIHHQPDLGEPYVATVSGPEGVTLTVRRFVEGVEALRIYQWLELPERWYSGPGIWQRIYASDGTYVLSEGEVVRETGKYEASA